MWKQKRGSAATYNNLIKVFERAGYKDYARFVQDLVQTDAEESNRNTIDQTPPSISEQPSPQIPVYPSECKEVSEPPFYGAADWAKLLNEDYKLGIIV